MSRLTTGDRALAAFGEGGAGEPTISRLKFYFYKFFSEFEMFKVELQFEVTCALVPPPLWQLSAWLVSSKACSSLPAAKTWISNDSQRSHQILVELFKVAGDDWYGERHDQHTTDSAHASHKLDQEAKIISISFQLFVQRYFRFRFPMRPCQEGSLGRYHRSQRLSL